MSFRDLSNEELVSYRDDALEFFGKKETAAGGQSLQAASDKLFFRLGRGKELEHALDESVKLQSHYAKLLNMYDGGQRTCFKDSEEWLTRLKAIQELREAEIENLAHMIRMRDKP